MFKIVYSGAILKPQVKDYLWYYCLCLSRNLAYHNWLLMNMSAYDFHLILQLQ